MSLHLVASVRERLSKRPLRDTWRFCRKVATLLLEMRWNFLLSQHEQTTYYLWWKISCNIQKS